PFIWPFGPLPATRSATVAAASRGAQSRIAHSAPAEPDAVTFVVKLIPFGTGDNMTKAFVGPGRIALALALDLSACTHSHDLDRRAISGVIGAGAGAAIGAAAGGETGAAIGAASGGALGISGATTTPPPPPRY